LEEIGRTEVKLFKGNLKMKLSQFRKLIREEVRKVVLKEDIINSDIESVLNLNLFIDVLGVTSQQQMGSNLNDEASYKKNAKWQAIVRKYTPVAKKYEAAIKNFAKSGMALGPKAISTLNTAVYDGEDGYDSVESSIEYLPSIYDKQVKLLARLMPNA
jgi:hypothetical protein